MKNKEKNQNVSKCIQNKILSYLWIYFQYPRVLPFRIPLFAQTTAPGTVTIASQDIFSEVNDGYCYKGDREIRTSDERISSEKWVEIEADGTKNQGLSHRKAKSILILLVRGDKGK